jgi:hypothetical protein
VLLLVFLISVLGAALPPPIQDPSRALAVLGEVLERSTLPVVAVVLLHAGFSGAAVPALWEVDLAGVIRPLLRLAALVYLLVALALPPLGFRAESLGAGRLQAELETRLEALAGLRQAVEQAPDAQALRAVLRQDPSLIAEIDRESGSPAKASSLSAQRDLAVRLLIRAQGNLRAQHQSGRADASGNLIRQIVRLSFTSAVYALFYAVAGFLWPGSVPALRLRVLERIERDRQDDDAPQTGPADVETSDDIP